MKKTILLFGLFLILSGITNAQTKSIPNHIEGYTWMEFYCGDQFIGSGEGYMNFLYIEHYQNGKLVWFKAEGFHGTLTSDWGETLSWHESDKVLGPFPWDNVPGFPTHTFHYNIIGDQGSHFIGSATYNWETGVITFDRAKCIGN